MTDQPNHSASKGNQNGANGRSGWRQDPHTDLFAHLTEEFYELSAQLGPGIQQSVGRDLWKSRIACEAVDVANMAMMIWDRSLQMPVARDPE